MPFRQIFLSLFDPTPKRSPASGPHEKKRPSKLSKFLARLAPVTPAVDHPRSLTPIAEEK
jgi:hypothetical protein